MLLGITVLSAAGQSVDLVQLRIDNVYMMFCAVLVFMMHLGFACLETGLTRAKNSTNILFKNISIVAIATLLYGLIGFNLMYPGAWLIDGILPNIAFGLDAPMINGKLDLSYNAGYTYWTDFLFQAMFAAATASIVSGAVCERIKLSSFLIFSGIFAGIIYPILGSAYWGGGFLSEGGFTDLAGSTLVHSVGGWAALAGIIMVGSRTGKYVEGRSNAIVGHNIPLATIGGFLLWFGWFGFNAGSQLDADPESTSYIFVTTLLSSCAGIVGAAIMSVILQKKPDFTMILNGALAGLVSITAGAVVIKSLIAVVAVGFIGGLIVVFSVLAFDRFKLDDPVGACSVHLVCGIWGTLAIGLFQADVSFTSQLGGVLYYSLAFPLALTVFAIIKATIGLRSSLEEETIGLDISEHGMESYSGFQILNDN